ncbi:MAG: heavy-metal-associated domain-containing protein [Clostridiales bacterium]|nr:heavy-metal-associated domain-containing protein [Clostridiales bacterium]
MEKKMLIEGMMCNHCKARVEKALSEVEGVTEAAVSLEEKTATIRMVRDIDDKVLMDAVAAKNFTPVRML